MIFHQEMQSSILNYLGMSDNHLKINIHLMHGFDVPLKLLDLWFMQTV